LKFYFSYPTNLEKTRINRVFCKDIWSTYRLIVDFCVYFKYDSPYTHKILVFKIALVLKSSLCWKILSSGNTNLCYFQHKFFHAKFVFCNTKISTQNRFQQRSNFEHKSFKSVTSCQKGIFDQFCSINFNVGIAKLKELLGPWIRLKTHYFEIRDPKLEVKMVLDHFTEKLFHRNFLTETPFDRPPLERMPFDRKFIRPNHRSTERRLTESSFCRKVYDRFFFQKMVI
jgi:hypothetical protein